MHKNDSLNHWLSLGFIIGPILFTLTWFVLGFISHGYTLWNITIASYSPISQPISGLGMGATAPYMNAAFVIYGLFLVIGSIGVFNLIPELNRRKQLTSMVLLSLSGIGAALCGIFTLESFMLHFLGFLFVLSPIVTFVIIGMWLRRISKWRKFSTWLIFGSPLTLILAIIYFASFNPIAAGNNEGIAGLTQRVLVMEIMVWFVALGVLSNKRR